MPGVAARAHGHIGLSDLVPPAAPAGSLGSDPQAGLGIPHFESGKGEKKRERREKKKKEECYVNSFARSAIDFF